MVILPVTLAETLMDRTSRSINRTIRARYFETEWRFVDVLIEYMKPSSLAKFGANFSELRQHWAQLPETA